jgi:hypothetical protein
MHRELLMVALVAAMSIRLAAAAEAPAPPATETPPSAPAEPSTPPKAEPSAAPAPAPAETPPPPAPATPTTTVLHRDEIQGLLGKPVRDGAGEDMGHIVNVIVDRSGQPRAVVIDFGGFLGVGSRKIAVDWAALHFAPDGKRDVISLDLTKDQVKSAPEYKEGQAVVVLGASGTSQPLPGDPTTPGQ